MISYHLIFDLPYIYAILGHISVSVESYRSSWSYMITPIYKMHTKTRTCSLFYHYPSVEPLLSHQVIMFDICMPSCFLFRETFPWRLGSFWVMEITHLMMDDFMSPDFRSTIHLCHTRAYFHFDWDLQIFMELHAHPHLRDTHWDDDAPIESLWSYPVRSTPFGTYMSSCFLLGYAFLICGSDSVMDSGDQDCIVDDWCFDVSWSFRPVTHSMPYWSIFALLVEICRSPWICMIIPSYEIPVRLMIRFHFVPIL